MRNKELKGIGLKRIEHVKHECQSSYESRDPSFLIHKAILQTPQTIAGPIVEKCIEVKNWSRIIYSLFITHYIFPKHKRE